MFTNIDILAQTGRHEVQISLSDVRKNDYSQFFSSVMLFISFSVSPTTAVTRGRPYTSFVLCSNKVVTSRIFFKTKTKRIGH